MKKGDILVKLDEVTPATPDGQDRFEVESCDEIWLAKPMGLELRYEVRIKVIPADGS